MDAVFFRCLVKELTPLLTGARLGKFHQPENAQPGAEITAIGLNKPGLRATLILRAAHKDGLVFLSEEKPANPPNPPARVMWLRKRCTGRGVAAVAADWPNRRLALELSGDREGRHLVLDLREGLGLSEEPPEGCKSVEALTEPGWPSLARAMDDPEVWRDYPHVSPPLRRRLAALTEAERSAFYAAVRAGDCGGFSVAEREGVAVAVMAWPPAPGETGTVAAPSAIEAALRLGQEALMAPLATTVDREHEALRAAEAKRLHKALKRVDEEEARCMRLMEDRANADALAAQLHALPKDYRGRSLTLDAQDGPLELELDPSLTLVDNMKRLYKGAAKGKRGLKHAARRRQELRAELARLEAGGAPGPRKRSEGKGAGGKSGKGAGRTDADRYKGVAVAVFQSSDGFSILRGKNDKANHAMLSKLAASHDYWFHAKDAPGSHVILRRDHPGREVPQQSLLEAAALAANKSGLAAMPKAEVMRALVKHVRKVKGLAHGSVRVDSLEEVHLVAPDQALETRLAKG